MPIILDFFKGGVKWNMTFSVKQIDKGGYYMKGFKKLTAGLMGVVMALGVCGFTAFAKEIVVSDETKNLQEIISNAEDGDTIKLTSNIKLESTLVIPSGKSGKNVTIDLGGKTLEGPDSGYAIQFGEFDKSGGKDFDECEYKNDGELIIENGEIDCDSAVLNYFGNVTFGDDLTIDAENRGITTYGGEVTVDGAEMTADGYGILTFNSFHAFFSTPDSKANTDNDKNISPTVTIENGSVINAGVSVISANNLLSAGTNVTINGGTLTVDEGNTAIYWPMEGELNITGGTIKGGTGIEAKMGTITISGDAKIIGTDTNTIDYVPVSGKISSEGSAIRLTTQMYGDIAGQKKEDGGLKLIITGGKLISENGKGITIYNAQGNKESSGDGQEANIEITGGEISGKLSAIKFVTENKENTATTEVSGNGYTTGTSKTTVKISSDVAPAAINNPAAINEKGNVVFYSDVNDAIEAANKATGTEEKEVEVAVYGDAVIDTDVTLKDNVKLVVAPDTELKANISANGDNVIVTKTENGNTVYEVANKAGAEESEEYVAKITSGGKTSYFDTLDSAVKTVQNGQTIELLRDCGEAEVTRDVSFYVVDNGFDYEIVAGDGYVNTGRGDEYDFITEEDYEDERDSGRHSYSLKEGKTERDDEEEEPVVTPEPEEEEGPFSDVGKDNPNYDAIVEVYEKGWMAGIADGVFAPNGTLTRGMAVTILWNRAGQPEPASVAPFLDVTSDAWYAKAVAWAYENGITSGYGDTYGPDDFLTTEQFTRMNDIANGRTPEVYVGGAPYATRGWVAGMLVME